jgi:hypothetical protein
VPPQELDQPEQSVRARHRDMLPGELSAVSKLKRSRRTTKKML